MQIKFWKKPSLVREQTNKKLTNERERDRLVVLTAKTLTGEEEETYTHLCNYVWFFKKINPVNKCCD